MSRQRGRRSGHEETATGLGPVFGGRLAPLDDAALHAIIDAAYAILAEVGMADAPAPVAERLVRLGATTGADGRLRFPRPLVEAALAEAPAEITLPGFLPSRDLTIGGNRVHLGTGGAAVEMLDAATGTYRDATLADLAVLMRVLDALPEVSYGLRPTVARDISGGRALDINTAFACLKSTAKPIGVSFCDPDNVGPIIDLFDMALGGVGAFAARPFCMGVIVHVVPPLRYAPEGVLAMEAAIAHGMIAQICSAGQAGATSPASLAGALAQGLAECLAGLMVVHALKPGAPCIYAFMPFVSDLRTGAMTGGGGEVAIANAAAAQLLARLGLPSTVSAGMTDAKVMDAQAGYEKGHTIALAAQAGANMINLSVGMLGSIMVASPEAMVIDAGLSAPILRAVRGIEVTPEALDISQIAAVTGGDGHYLGAPDTLRRMKTDYLYPPLANRQPVAEWVAAGSPSIWDQARARVAEILAAPAPDHLSPETEARIRASFDIRLPAAST